MLIIIFLRSPFFCYSAFFKIKINVIQNQNKMGINKHCLLQFLPYWRLISTLDLYISESQTYTKPKQNVFFLHVLVTWGSLRWMTSGMFGKKKFSWRFFDFCGNVPYNHLWMFLQWQKCLSLIYKSDISQFLVTHLL